MPSYTWLLCLVLVALACAHVENDDEKHRIDVLKERFVYAVTAAKGNLSDSSVRRVLASRFNRCSNTSDCIKVTAEALTPTPDKIDQAFLSYCAVLLLRLFEVTLGPTSNCNEERCATNTLSKELVTGSGEALYVNRERLRDRLVSFGRNYSCESKEVFDANDVLWDLNISSSSALHRDHIPELAAVILTRFLRGDCIKENINEVFLDSIFHKYGGNNSKFLDKEGILKLIEDLGIDVNQYNNPDDDDDEEEEDHDHDHDHHHHSSEHDSLLYEHDDHDNAKETIELHLIADSHDNNKQDSRTFGNSQNHQIPSSENDNKSQSVINKESSSLKSNETLNNTSLHELVRKKRHAHDHGHHEHSLVYSSDTPCWSANELFERFHISHTGRFTQTEFLAMCPALIQQKLFGGCENTANENKEKNMYEVYGYGTAAVLIISLCSVLGVVLMPIQKTAVYEYIMITLIALAFGTLTGDALLHLLPEAVGLHTHDDHDHASSHSHSEFELPEYFWKFLTVLGAIYGLFVFEGLADLAMHRMKKEPHHDNGHGHSHIPDIKILQMKSLNNNQAVSTETVMTDTSMPADLNSHQEITDQTETHASSPVCWGMTTLALIIIIGDGIHNVADGLTIGAAFASSTKGGISSALAIFFHELPHEFGDFVILLSTGFSYRKALFWNFISSLTAFIGLYVGIEIGENEAARQWILTVAAGMFLYIAIGDMLPELKAQKAKNGFMGFLAQNLGVLFGMGFMICMSVFEDQIKV